MREPFAALWGCELPVSLTANDLILAAPILGAPDADYYSKLLVGPLFSIPAPIVETPRITSHLVWTIPTNWERGITEEVSYRTEVITSRDGTEQRIAQRVNPRYLFRFGVRVGRNRAAELERLLVRRQAWNYRFPHPRAATLLARGDPGADGFSGRFDGEPVVTARTDRVLDLELAIKVNPGVYGGDYLTSIVYPEPYERHIGGFEIFPLKPNWADPVRITFGQVSEMLDLQRGVTGFNTPQRFTTRTIQCGFMIRNEDQENALRGLFQRMRGQQGEFFMADPLTAQIIPTASIADGASFFTLPGREVFDRFSSEQIYRNMLFTTRTGGFARKISSVTLVGGNTRVTFTSTMPATALSDIISVQWLLRMRFAADTMVFDWDTDRVGRTTLTLRALEDY